MLKSFEFFDKLKEDLQIDSQIKIAYAVRNFLHQKEKRRVQREKEEEL